MTPHFPFSANPAGNRLPYGRATAAQRALALAYLRQRLRPHFPTLQSSTWSRALDEFQPDLWVAGPAVVLAQPALTQLAQHLAAAPELPILDPPVYGLPALQLAQHSLRTNELAAWALPEVAAATIPCGPRLYVLLCHVIHPSSLAQQVVQAWCWNRASAPVLPPGILAGGPVPGSPEVEQVLGRLRPSERPRPGEVPVDALPPQLIPVCPASGQLPDSIAGLVASPRDPSATRRWNASARGNSVAR